MVYAVAIFVFYSENAGADHAQILPIKTNSRVVSKFWPSYWHKRRDYKK